MTVHCVSTMNKGYYNRIGKYMIYTWDKYSPDDYVLHLYLEDFDLPDNYSNKVVVEDWNSVSSMYKIWSESRFTHIKNQQGFTLKALSQIALFNKLKSGKVLWLDADTVLIDFLPENFFEDVIENYPLASWGEKTFESGTVWVDLDHKDWPAIQKQYEDIYIGNRGLPEGERWFDGELLGRAVQDADVSIRNLKVLKTKKTSTPLNYSWIGKYIRHLKAKAKKGDRLQDEMSYLNKSDIYELLKDHYV